MLTIVSHHSDVLQALADPTRRAILERLRKESLSVGDIANDLPVSRPAVSQHLRVLEGAGLVRARQDATRRVYSVELRGIVALKRYLDAFWEDALASFKEESIARKGKKKP